MSGTALAAGTVLHGRYRVLSRLGEGGMGSVYQVEDLATPGVVWALKVLLDDANTSPEDAAWARERFDAEIALMRELKHPRIPRFQASFTEGGRRCFVMEFIPGGNLEDRLALAHAPLPERDVLRWAIEICDALAYLHTQRPPIIVRDLKPGNIMVTPRGEARLIDLGIARTFKPGKLSNTENLGTMTYASPEHLGQGQTDARSDIYSLGATLYHLLTNVEPEPMTTPSVGSMRRYQPRISEDTERIVLRAMQLDPTRRFQTAVEMRDALRRCLYALEPVAPAQPAAPRQRQTQAQAQAVVLPRGARAVTSMPAASGRAGLPAPQRAPATRTALPAFGEICPTCGYLNRQGARFCSRDGTLLAVRPAHASHGASASPARPAHAKSISAAPVAASGRTTSGSTALGGSAELHLQRATEAFAAGRYAQAARQAEAAVSQGRGSYDTYLLLGQSYRKLGRPQEAAAALARATDARPTVDALRESALAYREAGKPEDAQIALAKARQLDPRDAELAYLLGTLCLDLGQPSQAEADLNVANELRPGHAPTLVALGQLAALRGHRGEAENWLSRAERVDPANVAAHLELGRLRLAEHRLAEAVRELERAGQLAPDSVEAQTALGMAYHAVGRRAAARDALRRALSLDPNAADARQLLRQM